MAQRTPAARPTARHGQAPAGCRLPLRPGSNSNWPAPGSATPAGRSLQPGTSARPTLRGMSRPWRCCRSPTRAPPHRIGRCDPRRGALHRRAGAHDRHRLGRQRRHPPVPGRAARAPRLPAQHPLPDPLALGRAGGQATDIAIQAQEIVKARQRIAHEIARETGKPIEVVLADIERDRWLSAEEAVDYGLVSRIVQRKSELRG
jgi:hypothetical protein